MATLKEIAKRCDCSVATVSKALNGMSDISEAMTIKVKQVADEMGYWPNAAARTLKTNRSKTIGLLMFLKNESVWTHEYFGSIANAIQDEMERKDYDVTPIKAESAFMRNGYLTYCRYRNYDGVIVMSAGFTEESLMELINSDIPLVTIDYAVYNRGAILSDNVKGIKELVHFLYDMGHRKIANIHGEDTYVTRTRLASFFSACEECGLTVPDSYMIPSIYHDPALCETATNTLLDSPDPPTVILYPDDFSMIGGLNALRARHMHVPNDISIVGYDCIPLAKNWSPRFTTIRQDGEGIGREAAKMLLRAIEKPKTFIPQHIVLPSTLVTGGTVKNLNP